MSRYKYSRICEEKLEYKCIDCGSTEHLHLYDGFYLCAKCVDRACDDIGREVERKLGGRRIMVNRSRERLIEQQLLAGYSDEECRKETKAPIQLIRDIRRRMRAEGRQVEPDTGPLF